jgi:hypothetical protein
MFAYMETQTLSIAEEEKRRLDGFEFNLRKQPTLARAQDFVRENASLALTGVALVGVVAACVVTRLLIRR